MPAETYPITGIPVNKGQPLPLRQEITAWASNPSNAYQVSLFLQALTRFKEKPVEEKIGYFQVSGIHSFPLVPWDDEGQPSPEPEIPGFCNHNLVTFPTWHRPYMLLYEQALYNNMLELIQAWEISDQEKATWLDAASQFRLPYWDWAQKQPSTGDYGIPQICAQAAWPIVMPGTNENTKPYENPLTGFLNPKTNAIGQRVPMGDPSMKANAIQNSGALPWDRCIGVSRYGVRSDEPESTWTNGINNWESCNAAVANPQWYDGQKGPLKSSSFADAVSRLFTTNYFDSWETFASTAHNDPKGTMNSSFMSLEYIHNIVHNASGGIYLSEDDVKPDPVGFTGLGAGHMSDVPVAAFDPIFWLHHCNIDRLCAIWQTLNWDMFFDKPYEGDPTPSDLLRPFHFDKQKGTWTSEMGRDWRNSNYQYDDLKEMPPGVPTEEYKTTLRQHVSKLYPSTSAVVSSIPGYTLPHETFNDYIVNVVYDRYALNGRAYSILFYIGEPTKGLSASKDDPNCIGNIYTFSAPLVTADGAVSCDNCGKQKAARVLSKAQIPLTLPLLRRTGQIQSGAFGIPATTLGPLDPDAVSRVLGVGLKWYFVENGGRKADPTEFPNTEVAVLKGQGQHPIQGRVMPRYQAYKKLTLATEGRRLGFGNREGPNDLIRDDPDI